MDTELVLSSGMLAGITKRVLIHFLEMMATGEITDQSKNKQMNIELLEENDSYLIRVTNCGPWTDNNVQLLNSAFRPLKEEGLLPENTVVAHVYTRTSGNDYEIAHDIQIAQTYWKIEMEKITNDAAQFPHLQEYLSIKIKYKLLPTGLGEFKTLLSNELALLRQGHPNVGITFHSISDAFRSSYDSRDANSRNCQLLSSALATVIRQSLNEEFRERCLDVLGVDNTHDAEKTILERLLSLIANNSTIPERDDDSEQELS